MKTFSNILLAISFISISFLSCSKKVTTDISSVEIPDTLSTQKDYFKPIELRYENWVYKDYIKSVRLHLDGSGASYPVIENSSQQLLLEFDDLRANYYSFYYKIILCNRDWTPSALFENEYIDGFYEEQITQYRSSFNALQTYTNYQIKFPNNRVKITIPGNYLLLVYEDTKDNPVLTKRFHVVSQQVEIKPNFRRAVRSDDINTKHKVNFNINLGQLTVGNVFSEIDISIQQNGRYDNAIRGLKPIFVNNGLLSYEYNTRENLFEAGNEYRAIDIRTFRERTMRVRNIWKDSLYHLDLVPDPSRSHLNHQSYRDLNGSYVIDQYGQDRQIGDPDYAWIHFKLDFDKPEADGIFYLFGELTNWQLLPDFKMKYDYSMGMYRCKAFLKQGYYDYMYAFVQDGSSVAKMNRAEGSHQQTENDYQLFVYHRKPGSRFDAIVGYVKFNSTF